MHEWVQAVFRRTRFLKIYKPVKNNFQEYLAKMYDTNELPKRIKITSEEMADMLCAGELVLIQGKW